MKTKNDIAIKVQGLAKSFGDVQAVATVDFEVNSGELFGFLGPNGAGKTSGAILFGVFNAFVPIVMAAFLVHLLQVAWGVFVPAVLLISVTSTFLGLFIAVAVSEVFEAQTFSNFFRFPLIFLCGLFFPIDALPVFLKPLSYALPLTYGADLLHGAVHGGHTMPFSIDLAMLAAFCVGLFLISLHNIRRRWIA
jgi:ABC-2 type transport system permease protein